MSRPTLRDGLSRVPPTGRRPSGMRTRGVERSIAKLEWDPSADDFAGQWGDGRWPWLSPVRCFPVQIAPEHSRFVIGGSSDCRGHRPQTSRHNGSTAGRSQQWMGHLFSWRRSPGSSSRQNGDSISSEMLSGSLASQQGVGGRPLWIGWCHGPDPCRGGLPSGHRPSELKVSAVGMS